MKVDPWAAMAVIVGQAMASPGQRFFVITPDFQKNLIALDWHSRQADFLVTSVVNADSAVLELANRSVIEIRKPKGLNGD